LEALQNLDNAITGQRALIMNKRDQLLQK